MQTLLLVPFAATIHYQVFGVISIIKCTQLIDAGTDKSYNLYNMDQTDMITEKMFEHCHL